MAATGVHVKALDSYPELIDLDQFYFDMHNTCGHDFQSVRVYCELYDLGREEILDSLRVLNMISIRVT